MNKKLLLGFLASISCDNIQICLHNYQDTMDELFFNISITDNYDRTIELTCSKTSGVLSVDGKCNYQVLDVIALISQYIQNIYRVESRKAFLGLNDD